MTSLFHSHLGLPATLHSFEDVRLLNMAERMGLPYTTGIVEFDWLKSQTKFVSVSVNNFVHTTIDNTTFYNITYQLPIAILRIYAGLHASQWSSGLIDLIIHQ